MIIKLLALTVCLIAGVISVIERDAFAAAASGAASGIMISILTSEA